MTQCTTCGASVYTIFDHVDRDCEHDPEQNIPTIGLQETVTANRESESTDEASVGSNANVPHHNAAFINAIWEEGTKEEACRYLQQTWNDCELKKQVKSVSVDDLVLMVINRDRRACNEDPTTIKHMMSNDEFRSQLGEYRAGVKAILDAAGVKYVD